MDYLKIRWKNIEKYLTYKYNSGIIKSQTKKRTKTKENTVSQAIFYKATRKPYMKNGEKKIQEPENKKEWFQWESKSSIINMIVADLTVPRKKDLFWQKSFTSYIKKERKKR